MKRHSQYTIIIADEIQKKYEKLENDIMRLENDNNNNNNGDKECKMKIIILEMKERTNTVKTLTLGIFF